MSHYQNFTPPFEIPESWEWVRLGDVIEEPKYGTSAKSLSKGKIPVLRMGNINKDGTVDYSNLVYSDNDSDIIDYQLKKGDILFNRTNSSDWVGKSALYNGEQKAIYAGYLVRVRPILILSEYLILVMTSDYYRNWCYLVKTDAVNQSNINAQKLVSFMLPLPPLKEQKRIIGSFFKLSKLVWNISDSCNMLSNMISFTKSKILDLAMQGKLVPQDPTDEPAGDMLMRINPKAKIITDTPHYHSICKQWIFSELQYVSKITMGQSPNGDSINNEDGIEFHQGKLYFGDTFLSVSPDKTNAPIRIIDGVNIILCVRAPVGIVNKCDRKICIGRGLSAISPTEVVNDGYLFYALKFLKPVFDANSTGSTFKAITGNVIKSAIIPVPPLNEQKRIVAKIEELYSVLDEIESSLQS